MSLLNAKNTQVADYLGIGGGGGGGGGVVNIRIPNNDARITGNVVFSSRDGSVAISPNGTNEMVFAVGDISEKAVTKIRDNDPEVQGFVVGEATFTSTSVTVGIHANNTSKTVDFSVINADQFAVSSLYNGDPADPVSVQGDVALFADGLNIKFNDGRYTTPNITLSNNGVLSITDMGFLNPAVSLRGDITLKSSDESIIAVADAENNTIDLVVNPDSAGGIVNLTAEGGGSASGTTVVLKSSDGSVFIQKGTDTESHEDFLDFTIGSITGALVTSITNNDGINLTGNVQFISSDSTVGITYDTTGNNVDLTTAPAIAGVATLTNGVTDFTGDITFTSSDATVGIEFITGTNTIDLTTTPANAGVSSLRANGVSIGETGDIILQSDGTIAITQPSAQVMKLVVANPAPSNIVQTITATGESNNATGAITLTSTSGSLDFQVTTTTINIDQIYPTPQTNFATVGFNTSLDFSQVNGYSLTALSLSPFRPALIVDTPTSIAYGNLSFTAQFAPNITQPTAGYCYISVGSGASSNPQITRNVIVFDFGQYNTVNKLTYTYKPVYIPVALPTTQSGWYITVEWVGVVGGASGSQLTFSNIACSGSVLKTKVNL